MVELQKKINGKFSDQILKILSALAIIIAFAYLIFPFFPAMIMGAILALALSSFTKKIERRGTSRKKALNILMIGLFVIFFIPTTAFLIRGSLVLTDAIKNPEVTQKISTLQNQLINLIEKYAPTFGLSIETITSYAEQSLGKITGFTLTLFSNILSEVPTLGLFTLIMTISIYFFLYYELKIREYFDNYFGFSIERGEQFIRVLKTSSREVFLSNVLTGILQAAVVTIGSAIFQVSELFLIFFITFIASFIPVVGAGPVAFIISMYSFVTGDTTAGIGMLIISIITGVADNVIRPYLATLGEVEVPAFISFLAVLGGVITMGLPGLFLGPLIASLTFGTIPIFIEEFFPKQIMSEENKHE